MLISRDSSTTSTMANCWNSSGRWVFRISNYYASCPECWKHPSQVWEYRKRAYRKAGFSAPYWRMSFWMSWTGGYPTSGKHSSLTSNIKAHQSGIGHWELQAWKRFSLFDTLMTSSSFVKQGARQSAYILQYKNGWWSDWAWKSALKSPKSSIWRSDGRTSWVSSWSCVPKVENGWSSLNWQKRRFSSAKIQFEKQSNG